MPPTSKAMLGKPQAIASNKTIGKPSLTEGNKNMSAAQYKLGNSEFGRSGICIKLSFKLKYLIKSLILLNSEPSPTIIPCHL